MRQNQSMTTTIMRDMTDGVMVIDNHGEIQYVNPSGEQILDQKTDYMQGIKYIDFMDKQNINDDFHQFVLDAVYDKSTTHSGVVSYETAVHEKKLKISTSFVFNEDKTEQLGISVVFSDVTETERLTRLRRDSSVIFSVLMSCITLYIFIWAAVKESSFNIAPNTMTLVVEIMAIISMVIVLKNTSFMISDFNLRLKNPLHDMLPSIIISASVVALMVVIKAIVIGLKIPFFPADRPFLDFAPLGIYALIYPLTALLQEVLARCMMQTSLCHVFTGRYATMLSIFVSSLIFGTVHIAYGIKYMLAAFLLLSALGCYYAKSRNLWGTALIHYVLGVSVVVLHYTI